MKKVFLALSLGIVAALLIAAAALPPPAWRNAWSTNQPPRPVVGVDNLTVSNFNSTTGWQFWAVGPKTVARLSDVTNIASTISGDSGGTNARQGGSLLLSNLVSNPYAGYTNQAFGGTNVSVRTAGGTNFIDTTGQLNNWGQLSTNTLGDNGTNAARNILLASNGQWIASSGGLGTNNTLTKATSCLFTACSVVGETQSPFRVFDTNGNPYFRFLSNGVLLTATNNNGFYMSNNATVPGALATLGVSNTPALLISNNGSVSIAGPLLTDLNGNPYSTNTATGGLATNANQFAANTTLNIKSAALLTNIQHYAQLNLFNGLIDTNTSSLSTFIETNGFLWVESTNTRATVIPKLILTNASVALTNSQSLTPAILLEGHGFTTSGAGGSQPLGWGIWGTNVQASANPSSILNFGFHVNGGAYSYPMTLSSAGTVNANTFQAINLTVLNGAIAQAGGALALTAAGGTLSTFGGADCIRIKPASGASALDFIDASSSWQARIRAVSNVVEWFCVGPMTNRFMRTITGTFLSTPTNAAWLEMANDTALGVSAIRSLADGAVQTSYPLHISSTGTNLDRGLLLGTNNTATVMGNLNVATNVVVTNNLTVLGVGSVMATNTAAHTTVSPANLHNVALGKGWTNDLGARADLVLSVKYVDAVTGDPSLAFTNSITGEAWTNTFAFGIVGTMQELVTIPDLSPNDRGSFTDLSGAGSSVTILNAWWKLK